MNDAGGGGNGFVTGGNNIAIGYNLANSFVQMTQQPQTTYILALTLLPAPLVYLTPLCLEVGQPWASLMSL